MSLRPDWKAILTRAWSIRFLVLAGVLETAGAAMQGLIDNGVVSVSVHVCAAALTAAAGVARLYAQKNLPATDGTT
jgi:hypothetical protein